jgi:ketosteroid isomerase-like protein
LALAAAFLSGPAHAATPPDLASQVREAEAAFAKTMADRDHAAFVSFLSGEAIFVGPNRVLRGKQEVAEGWKRFFEEPEAPFAWAPERVEVLGSGKLALSSGPVLDPAGRRIGTFNSVWRREGPDCECEKNSP